MEIVAISVQILVTQSDVGVSRHSKTHPLFMYICTLMDAHVHTVLHTSVQACFLFFFYNHYMSLSIYLS